MTFKVIFKAVSSEEMQGLSLGGSWTSYPPPAGSLREPLPGLRGLNGRRLRGVSLLILLIEVV